MSGTEECVVDSNFTIDSEWIEPECQKHFNLNIPSICADNSLETENLGTQ